MSPVLKPKPEKEKLPAKYVLLILTLVCSILMIISFTSDGLENVMLGHLSKENNFPELAYKSVSEQIEQNKKLHLEVASRFEPSQFFDVS